MTNDEEQRPEENAGPRKESEKPGLRKLLLPWLITAVAAILIGVPIWLYFLEKKNVQEPGNDTTESPADGIPQGDREVIKLSASDFLEQGEEGEPGTAEMHFILGLDAYNKGDKKEAAKHWEIAALSGNNPNAYFNLGNVLLDLAGAKGDEALFRESCDKYAEAVRLKPDYHEAYGNWGNALTGLAWIKKDEALFQQAFDKYAEAVRLKPDKYKALNNWGNALSDLARMKSDEALFRESFEKYAATVRIEPDNPLCYHNWAGALRACAEIVEDEAERDVLLRQAMKKVGKAEQLHAAEEK